MLCSRVPVAPFMYSTKAWIMVGHGIDHGFCWYLCRISIYSLHVCSLTNALEHSPLGDTHQPRCHWVRNHRRIVLSNFAWSFANNMELHEAILLQVRGCAFLFHIWGHAHVLHLFIASRRVVSSCVCMKWVWSGLGHRFHSHSERNGTATPVLKEEAVAFCWAFLI